jgi:DNA-binding IclR family transcriptional regulator
MQDTVPRSRPSRVPGIQAIARAGTVLRALERVPDGLGLAELAQAVGLPKSTVHRLVGALAAEELLQSTADGRIVLGGGLMRLAETGRRTLPTRVRPALAELSAQLGETVDLALLDGSSVRFVDQIAGTHRLAAVSSVGAEFPLHCTANGKALLAALPQERALSLLPERLPRLTAATITSRRALLAELEMIRASGVAFDREEHTEGICATGAVITGFGGPAAALSVPVPAARFLGRERRYERAVAAAAAHACALLGEV